MGIKVISVFHGNREAGFPSHQGVVMLFDAQYGQLLMLFDAGEITAIRTAAASAWLPVCCQKKTQSSLPSSVLVSRLNDILKPCCW